MMAMAAMLAAQQAQQPQAQEPPAKKSKKGDDGLSISGCCTYLFQLRLLRMRILIETIHPSFDTVTTGKWEVDELMRLTWILSGMEA